MAVKLELIPVGNLRTQDGVLPFRWLCSLCAHEFVVQHFVTSSNDPRYALEFATVQHDFAWHLFAQHKEEKQASSAAASGGL